MLPSIAICRREPYRASRQINLLSVSGLGALLIAFDGATVAIDNPDGGDALVGIPALVGAGASTVRALELSVVGKTAAICDTDDMAPTGDDGAGALNGMDALADGGAFTGIDALVGGGAL